MVWSQWPTGENLPNGVQLIADVLKAIIQFSNLVNEDSVFKIYHNAIFLTFYRYKF